MSTRDLSRVIVIALGGNLGGPAVVIDRFRGAIESLSRRWGPPMVSSCYRSEPVGSPQDQNDFINAAAVWQPAEPVSPEQSLRALQGLETFYGRQREVANGPRTLDLDLLLHGVEQRDRESLLLPHPRIAERAFVLLPLSEIFGGDFVWPGSSQSVDDCLADPLVAAQRCVAIRPCSLVPERSATDCGDA